MFPVFYASRVLWAGILHWGQRPAVVNAVPNLEKTIRITENQQQGTTHRHDFTVNSAAAANRCGDYCALNAHADLQLVRQFYSTFVVFLSTDHNLKNISGPVATKAILDDMSDMSNDTHSSMPSLEYP
jgi:hypothetical protein